MSGFVSAGGARLTARRLFVGLGACLAACAVIAVIAPLIGVDPQGKTGPELEMLGLDALTPSGALHHVWVMRAKDVAQSLLVGMALGGAGCVLQALLRNPLADPFTLGISSGSSLAAVIAIRIGAEQALGGFGVSIAALVGAAGTLAVVFQLGKVGKHLPPATLILAGVAIAMFCSAASVLIQVTSDFAQVSHMLSWMIGGLDPSKFEIAKLMAVPIFVGLAVLVLYARELDALAAGPEVAASLGVAVARTQLVVFGTASLLVGAASAVAGPIGFVGLVVPHALRGVVGPDHRLLVPASMLCGAIVLTACDTFSRVVMLGHPILPTGAVTPVLGVPVFLAILLRERRRAALWGQP